MIYHAVNTNDVELKKTGQGNTRFLYESKDGPNIMIRYWGPETDLDVHSHPYNEMWYVLEGEVQMGDTVYGPGAMIFIGKDVPYGPTRVPKGTAALLRYAEGRGG